MDESQKQHTKEEEERVQTVCFQFYRILEQAEFIYDDRKQISDCPGPGVSAEDFLPTFLG